MDGEDGFSDAVLFDTVSRRVSGEQVRKGSDGMAGRRTRAISKSGGSDCVELGRRRTGSLSVGHATECREGQRDYFRSDTITSRSTEIGAAHAATGNGKIQSSSRIYTCAFWPTTAARMSFHRKRWISLNQSTYTGRHCSEGGNSPNHRDDDGEQRQ